MDEAKDVIPEKLATATDVAKAFEFISQQLATLRLTKQEHMLVEQIMRSARPIAFPKPTDVKTED